MCRPHRPAAQALEQGPVPEPQQRQVERVSRLKVHRNRHQLETVGATMVAMVVAGAETAVEEAVQTFMISSSRDPLGTFFATH